MAEREVDPRSFQMLTAGPSFGTIHGHNVIAGQQTFGGTAINNIYLPGKKHRYTPVLKHHLGEADILRTF
jgi:hypothetical protein